MIELYLSTDGKHTVHASAQTPEEMNTLAPIAKALYQKVLTEFGTKPQLWQNVINGQSNGKSKSNGHAQAVKRIDTAEQAQAPDAPICPMHKRPMKYRNGRLGPFWSCPTRKPDGRWCPITKEVTGTGNGQAEAA